MRHLYHYARFTWLYMPWLIIFKSNSKFMNSSNSSTSTKKPFDLLYDEEIYTDNDFHDLLKYFTVVMQEKEPASAAATEEDHNLFHDI